MSSSEKYSNNKKIYFKKQGYSENFNLRDFVCSRAKKKLKKNWQSVRFLRVLKQKKVLV